jgi:hypothetical protein
MSVTVSERRLDELTSGSEEQHREALEEHRGAHFDEVVRSSGSRVMCVMLRCSVKMLEH